MRVCAGIVCLVLLAACGACSNADRDRQANAEGTSPAEASAGARQGELQGTSVVGTVRHVDLEGGFYGIVTDDGARLDPVNLPAEFQKDGVRVRVQVESLKDRVSLRMWGTLVRIVAIERL